MNSGANPYPGRYYKKAWKLKLVNADLWLFLDKVFDSSTANTNNTYALSTQHKTKERIGNNRMVSVKTIYVLFFLYPLRDQASFAVGLSSIQVLNATRSLPISDFQFPNRIIPIDSSSFKFQFPSYFDRLYLYCST